MKLTDDTKELVTTHLRKGRIVSKRLQDKIDNNTVTQEDINVLAFLLEGHLGDVLKGLDYQSVLKEEQEKRYEEIRIAYQRIQTLEEQLANVHELSGFSGMFKKIQDTLRDWWQKEGFNHVEDTKLLSYGVIEVTFSFLLSSRVSMFSKTPKADREDLARHKQALRNQGFLFNDNGEYTAYKDELLDTQQNKDLLLKLVRKRFPSFKIKSFEVAKHDGTPIIMSFTGTIADLEEFE